MKLAPKLLKPFDVFMRIHVAIGLLSDEAEWWTCHDQVHRGVGHAPLQEVETVAMENSAQACREIFSRRTRVASARRFWRILVKNDWSFQIRDGRFALFLPGPLAGRIVRDVGLAWARGARHGSRIRPHFFTGTPGIEPRGIGVVGSLNIFVLSASVLA
jgi:hypothetical protein